MESRKLFLLFSYITLFPFCLSWGLCPQTPGICRFGPMAWRTPRLCPLAPAVVVSTLEPLLWRIGLCRQAPRAPQQSSGRGDAIAGGGIALLLSCCWRKAKNARGPGTASPVFAGCRSQSTRKPDEPLFFPSSPLRSCRWRPTLLFVLVGKTAHQTAYSGTPLFSDTPSWYQAAILH